MTSALMEQAHVIADGDWTHPAQFDEGIDQIVLSNSLDEQAKTGSRTRLVRFAPGARTTVPFIHDYHEEVYLLEGDQVQAAAEARPQAGYPAHTYFKRPAGTWHGPFHSETGCLLLEVHYY